MKSRKGKFFSWRLKVILTLGALAGLALALFSDYVASINDDSIGPTPLSWGVKAQAARAAAFFGMEGLMDGAPGEPPPIDSTVPEETEYALFALG